MAGISNAIVAPSVANSSYVVGDFSSVKSVF